MVSRRVINLVRDVERRMLDTVHIWWSYILSKLTEPLKDLKLYILLYVGKRCPYSEEEISSISTAYRRKRAPPEALHK